MIEGHDILFGHCCKSHGEMALGSLKKLSDLRRQDRERAFTLTAHGMRCPGSVACVDLTTLKSGCR